MKTPSFASLTHLAKQRFAAELWRHGDLSLAYRRATGSAAAARTVALAAKAWLNDPLTQQYLASEFDAVRQRMALDQDRHAEEVCALAYSDIGDVCTWSAAGVTVKASQDIPASARRAIQSIKSTTRRLGESVETRTEVTLHPKMPALALLHTMFDRGQAVRQHLESRLRDLAGIAAKYVPREQHAQYLAEVRVVMGPGGAPASPGADALDDSGAPGPFA